VIAESFERIHRSNLVGMGVLPLELEPGLTVQSLGLDGTETVDIEGIAADLTRGGTVAVTVRRETAGAAGVGGDGEPRPAEITFNCRVRLDSTVDLDDFRHGGVLPRVLRLKLGLGDADAVPTP